LKNFDQLLLDDFSTSISILGKDSLNGFENQVFHSFSALITATKN